MKKILLALLLIAAFSSCTRRIYESPEFVRALAAHRTVAILPADVIIQLRPNQAKATTREQLADMQRRTGIDIQEKMSGWLLRRSDRFQYTVSFQEVFTTNAKLKEAGISYEDLASTDRSRLAKLLGVDAVLQSRMVMEKPMSEGASIALGIAVGFWGNTNKVTATVNIHDAETGKLLWKYENWNSGTVGSSSTRLVDALMRNVSRRFPYSSRN